MHRGYIKLWRALADNSDYLSQPFTRGQAWIDLLLLANYKDSRVVVRGIQVDVKAGQVVAGEEFLSHRWKWSRNKVRRYLVHLSSKTIQQIEQQKSNVITIISIVNWDLYQGNGTTNDTTNETTNDTTERQQKDILKNIQEYTKNNKEIYKERFSGYSKEFNVTFEEFIKMRKLIKKPMTNKAIELALKKLETLSTTEEGKIAILNQSIENSWQGLFEIKVDRQATPEISNPAYRKFDDV